MSARADQGHHSKTDGTPSSEQGRAGAGGQPGSSGSCRGACGPTQCSNDSSSRPSTHPSRQRIPSSPVPSCPPQIAAYSCPPILPMARSCPVILPMARHRLPPTHPSFNQSILLHIAPARRPSTRPTRAHHTHPPIHPLTHLLDLSHAIQPSAHTSAQSLPCHRSISTSPPIHPPIHSMSSTPSHLPTDSAT